MSDATQTPADDFDPSVEVAGSPAPLTETDGPRPPVGSGGDEDGVGNAAPAPSSTTDSEEDADEDHNDDLAPASSASSSESTTAAGPVETHRARIRDLEDRRHRSSAGFGVSGKFEGAREDRDAQGEDEDA